MGNQQIQQKSYNGYGNNNCSFMKQIQIQNWSVLQSLQSDANTPGQYVIMKNEVTEQIAQVYTILFERKQTFQLYLEEYYTWRSLNKPNIIQTKHIYIQPNNNQDQSFIDKLCSNSYCVKLFLQNISISLSEIKDIPIAQSLYILLSAMNGFQYLFKIFGYFTIKESMIGLNQEGVVKVWMNLDYSSNRPFIDKSYSHNSQRGLERQAKFVKQLLEIIDKNTDHQGRQLTFKKYIIGKYGSSFKGLNLASCKKYLLNFAQQNQIDLPEDLSAILDILFQRTNKTQNSHQNISSNNNHILYGKNYQNMYLLGEQNNLSGSKNINQNSQQYMVPKSQSHFKRLQCSNQNSSSKNYHKNSSDIGSQLFMPKASIKYENSTPRMQSSPPISPHKQNSFQQGGSNHSFNEFRLQHNNPNSSSMPKMTFSYAYENQKYNTEKKLIQNGNVNYMVYSQNPYRSLVQKQMNLNQSTIRQEIEQDSFFASYRNSKFIASNKRGSNNIKNKNSKNSINGHVHALSSHSESKMIHNDDYIPQQLNFDRQCLQIEQNNDQKRKSTRRSKKSIVFHTANQTKQLDDQIANDLQQMMTTINV